MIDEATTRLILWTTFFLVAYAGFCIYWGARHSERAKTAFDFFLAGRSVPYWVFIMSATTASFAGWIFIAQPGLILRDGLPAAYLSFCAIVVPLGGVFFLKRQWMLSKRFGFVTPGEMYAAYYQSQLPSLFTVLVALLFAIPFFGAAMAAAGGMLSVVTDGWLSREAGMWLLATLTVIYVTAGGIRAFSYVCTLQALLIASGVIVLGVAALSLAGGFEALNQGLSSLARDSSTGSTLGRGGGDYDGWFAVAGVIQWTAGLERELPAGSIWTGAMILSFLVAFMGVQMSPMFSMLAYTATDVRPFAAQQVWYSALGVGALLFIFATLQGVAAYLIGASGDVAGSGLPTGNYLPDLGDDWHGQVVPHLVRLVADASPWLGSVVTVCTVVAVTAATGAYLVTSSAVITRDVFVRYFETRANDGTQVLFGRIVMLILALLGVLMATFARESMIVLGALTLSLSVQLLPALVGLNWFSWITRQGVNAGLLVGVAAVVLSGEFGQYLAGDALPWGQSPWTIYPALWGLFFNVITCLIASAVTSGADGASTRRFFHGFLSEHDAAAPKRRGLVSAAWVLTLGWVFFSIGPGAVFGNWAFGAPDAGYEEWDFAMPSIWVWQLLWWGAGVLLIWFLAYAMRLATGPLKHFAAITDDFRTLDRGQD